MCLAQGPQRSDTGVARTRGPKVSSQALYHLSHCALYHVYRGPDEVSSGSTLIVKNNLHKYIYPVPINAHVTFQGSAPAVAVAGPR